MPVFDLPDLPDLPLLRTHEVVHLGTLDHDRRREQYASSQEGHALSVSHAPHAWQRIARLGGEPMQVLERAEGCFLDVLELQRSSLWRDALDTWALNEGLATRRPCWRAWVLDAETDAWTFTTHDQEADAEDTVLDQVGDTLAPGPDGRPSVEPVMELVATPLLRQRLGLPEGTPVYNVADTVLMAWADAHLATVDGVWWTEAYDPDGLSAPRGGIFPSRLGRWTVRPGDLASYEDDEHGQRMNVDVLPVPLTAPWLLPDGPPVVRQGRRARPG